MFVDSLQFPPHMHHITHPPPIHSTQTHKHTRTQIMKLLAKQGLINPAHLRVVIVTQADCTWVVTSQPWLSYFSSVTGWLSCQSDCPNVEQLEISPRGLVLGGGVCGFVPPSRLHCSRRGRRDPSVRLLPPPPLLPKTAWCESWQVRSRLAGDWQQKGPVSVEVLMSGRIEQIWAFIPGSHDWVSQSMLISAKVGRSYFDAA